MKEIEYKSDIKLLLRCILLNKKITTKEISCLQSRYPEIVNNIIAVKIFSNNKKK